MNLAPFPLFEEIPACRSCRDFTEVAELSIIWVGSEFQLLCRDSVAEGKTLHKILQVGLHPLPSSQKIREKSLVDSRLTDVKDGMV